MTSPSAVFYQGEPGAYSNLAALALFPHSQPEGLPQFKDVFDRLAVAGTEAVAVLPIENSIYGSVHPVLDLLQTSSFTISAEYKLRIRHCLLANPGVSFDQIREVYSHPQALGQCEVFFREHPALRPVPWPDTAGAARFLAGNRETTHIAAIASEQAAEVYGLQVLKRNIESFGHNFTRFVVISSIPEKNPSANKTSIWFEAKDIPGSLYQCLGCFARRDLNLLRIENRPVWGKAWKQIFYIDFRGNAMEERVQQALEELATFTESFHFLGSYFEDESETGHQPVL